MYGRSLEDLQYSSRSKRNQNDRLWEVKDVMKPQFGPPPGLTGLEFPAESE